MQARSPSEVGMVTPSDFFSVPVLKRCRFRLIMPSVFARVMRWCVCGAVRIWDGDVVVYEVWLGVVGVGVMFSIVVPKQFASCCNASLWRPWNFWFSFLIF